MKIKKLKSLGREKYGNKDKRIPVPCWSISQKSNQILTNLAAYHHASRSYVFEAMIKNIMLLHAIGEIERDIPYKRGRATYIPKLCIHPIYINYITSLHKKSSSNTVNFLIEFYHDKYFYELYLPNIL